MTALSNVTSPAWPKQLRRKDAAAYLEIEHGIKLAPQTLARKAVEGGGPPINSPVAFLFTTTKRSIAGPKVA